jgi:hypothetical protein
MSIIKSSNLYNRHGTPSDSQPFLKILQNDRAVDAYHNHVLLQKLFLHSFGSVSTSTYFHNFAPNVGFSRPFAISEAEMLSSTSISDSDEVPCPVSTCFYLLPPQLWILFLVGNL